MFVTRVVASGGGEVDYVGVTEFEIKEGCLIL
jgi:hypothetical protein